MPKHQSSKPIAKAIPHPSGNGYAGQFALPGMVPRLVTDAAGPIRYPDEKAAHFGAMCAGWAVYEARTLDKHPAKEYERMSAAELAQALVDAELTPTEFAELCGVPQARVMYWLDGTQEIPHSAHVLIDLLKWEDNFTAARRITDEAKGLRKGL